MTSAVAASSPRRFGPPRFGLWAFFWAVVQPLRAVWWQLRFTELRALAMVPAAVTLVLGTALVMASVLLAAPAQNLLMTHGQGVLGNAAWVLVRILVHVVLGFAAVVATIRLQAAVAGAALERMALFVQRRILGTAPEPAIGLGRMVVNALRALLPSLRSLVLWGLTALAAATVVLIPVVGPALVFPVEAALAAGFLAHGAVIDSRERLGLPRFLYLKEPACLLGLTVGFVPFVLFPPLMIVGGGAIAVSGALVAVGLSERRRETTSASAAEPEAEPAGGSPAKDVA